MASAIRWLNSDSDQNWYYLWDRRVKVHFDTKCGAKQQRKDNSEYRAGAATYPPKMHEKRSGGESAKSA